MVKEFSRPSPSGRRKEQKKNGLVKVLGETKAGEVTAFVRFVAEPVRRTQVSPNVVIGTAAVHMASAVAAVFWSPRRSSIGRRCNSHASSPAPIRLHSRQCRTAQTDLAKRTQLCNLPSRCPTNRRSRFAPVRHIPIQLRWATDNAYQSTLCTTRVRIFRPVSSP